MQKAHSNIEWENYPSIDTPVNEQNLNKMDRSIDAIDDRVISLDTTKFNVSDAQTLIKDISFNYNTGVITITYYNGSTATINTGLAQVAVNFEFDEGAQILYIIKADGSRQPVDLSAFITDYEFLDSDTVAFSVDTSGKVTAVLKEGSVQEKHLQPNYLADIKVEAAKAQASEQEAKKSENAAKESQDAAKSSENAASGYASSAAASEATATQKAADAEGSAVNAANSATDAAGSAATATQKAADAADSAANAENSASAATSNASSAATSATDAAGSAASADTYAKQSQSFAKGGTGTREGEDTDNALYYKMQAKAEADRAKEEADRAGEVSNIGIATTEKAGIVKPDGTTITVSEDGTISGSNQIEIDSALSKESENPVQNKVIANAIDGISQDLQNLTPADIGALPSNGKAASSAAADKLSTPRNISITGDVEGTISPKFDGSSDGTISVIRRGVYVGGSANDVSKPWYRFASISVANANQDRAITFKVRSTYGDGSTELGILTAHIRTNNSGFQFGNLVWEYAVSGISVDKFVMLYTTAFPCNIELWIKVDAAYRLYHLEVMSEGDRVNRGNIWTLYNIYSSANGSASLPSGYTQKQSTLAVLKNSILGDSATAVKKTNVLTTKEQVNANTNVENVASATVVKEINSDLSNSISKLDGILGRTLLGFRSVKAFSGQVNAGVGMNIYTSNIPKGGASLCAFMLGNSMQCMIYLKRMKDTGQAVNFDKVFGAYDVTMSAAVDGVTAFRCTGNVDDVLIMSKNQ